MPPGEGANCSFNSVFITNIGNYFHYCEQLFSGVIRSKSFSTKLFQLFFTISITRYQPLQRTCKLSGREKPVSEINENVNSFFSSEEDYDCNGGNTGNNQSHQRVNSKQSLFLSQSKLGEQDLLLVHQPRELSINSNCKTFILLDLQTLKHPACLSDPPVCF